MKERNIIQSCLRKIGNWVKSKISLKKNTGNTSNGIKQNKLVFKKGQQFGIWTIESEIRGGGNGSIWFARNQQGEKYIIKILKKSNQTARKRFLDEIKILQLNQDVGGVMPLIDHCDVNKKTENLWYVMPQAQLLKHHLAKALPEEIIVATIELAKTLSILHGRKTYHRDIKPQNLFFLNGRYTIGDFGLGDFEQRENELTVAGEPLGPRWTMAPEMRRNPELADAAKADVYSLAKTLWILLTGIEKGYEGQYNHIGSIGLSHFYHDLYLTSLDAILVKSTENDAKERPDINEFVQSLENWIEINKDFIRRNATQWLEVQQKLFPVVQPSRIVWQQQDAILTILNILGGIESLNHMMFPGGGGMDLDSAIIATEQKCIELICHQIPYIIKPKRLIFEGFNGLPEWNYFRLETDDLEPIDAYSDSQEDEEEVYETRPGNYISRVGYENYYHANGIYPEGSRRVVRILKGSFVIFQKTSSYNMTPSTYDGRHNTVDADTFRNYIKSVMDSRYKVEKVLLENGLRKKIFTNGPLPDIHL